MREETSMYEWDEAKRRSNQIKHDVDFKGIEAFDWELYTLVTNHWVVAQFEPLPNV